MSDGEALLRAILDAPDDDAPRLVYADWLDENGQADRAEFIRVQIALAEMEREPARQKLDPKRGVYAIAGGGGLQLGYEPTAAIKERDALRRRERELLGIGRELWFECWLDSWTSELRKGESRVRYFFGVTDVVVFQVNWSRGFVRSLTCTAADWLAHADAITAAHPLREVRLMTWPEGRWNADETGFALVHRGHTVMSAHAIRSECVKNCLASFWPGITFHLPELADPRRTATPRLMYR